MLSAFNNLQNLPSLKLSPLVRNLLVLFLGFHRVYVELLKLPYAPAISLPPVIQMEKR